MLFIQTRSGRIIQGHYKSRSAALDCLINWDFVYAEWCGQELKSADLSGH